MKPISIIAPALIAGAVLITGGKNMATTKKTTAKKAVKKATATPKKKVAKKATKKQLDALKKGREALKKKTESAKKAVRKELAKTKKAVKKSTSKIMSSARKRATKATAKQMTSLSKRLKKKGLAGDSRYDCFINISSAKSFLDFQLNSNDLEYLKKESKKILDQYGSNGAEWSIVIFDNVDRKYIRL